MVAYQSSLHCPASELLLRDKDVVAPLRLASYPGSINGGGGREIEPGYEATLRLARSTSVGIYGAREIARRMEIQSHLPGSYDVMEVW